jgi:hypothetical protein
VEAGDVVVRIVAKDENYSAVMTRARREAQQFGKTVEAAGHATVTSQQAASGAIRLLEGDITRNVRAVEKFITTIPGVGKVLQAAFPIVGALAFAGVIYKMGEEVFEAVKKVQQLRDKARESFLSLTEGAIKSADSLRVTNDKLEEQIAILQHKPVNTVATALDEARERADELAISLNKDYTALKQIMDTNQVGVLGRIMGKGSTKDVGSGEQDRLANIRTLGLQAQQQELAGDTSGATATGVLIKSAQEEALKWAKQQYAMRSGRQQYQPDGSIAYGKSFSGPSATFASANGDQGQNLDALQSFQTLVGSQLLTAQQLQRNTTDQAKLKQLEQAKQQAEDAKRAMEAAKQAQKAIVEQWQEALRQDKANGEISVAQEATYWAYRAETARKGSLSYRMALDEANKASGKINAESMSTGKSAAAKLTEFGAITDDTVRRLPQDTDASKGDNAEFKSQGNGAVEYLKNLNAGIQLQHANADAIAEASLRMAEMTGQMSRLDVAQAMSALHAQQYADATKSLSAALANAQNLPPGFEREQRIAGLQNQGTQMAGQRQIQVMQDQQGVAGQQLGPAMQQALGQMVNEWENMTTAIVQVMTRTINSFNDNITKAIMGKGKASDFGKTFEQAGQGLIKTGLQKAEGSALSWLTHGKIGGAKADGSKTSPFYVVMAGTGGGPTGGAAGGLAGIAGTAMNQIGGAPGILKGVGGWLGGLLQGAFAGGGDVVANRPALIGERGPELFTPSTAGRITPNYALGSGGGDSHMYMIDARGSNDPMAIHAAVARALPHAVAASVQAQHSAKMRMPYGR